MARSRWKLISFSKSVWRKIFYIKKVNDSLSINNLKQTTTAIKSRKSFIPLCFKGLSVFIHKGSTARKLDVNRLHIGYKFGEYAYTRKLYYYPLKKKKRR